MTLFTINSPKLFFTGGIEIAVDAPLAIETGITALTGENGSGKTLFARTVETGWNFLTNDIKSATGAKPSIKYLEFNDVHSWTGGSATYYQQRYEATMNDEVPTVADAMGDKIHSEEFARLSALLGLPDVASRKINYLSSGELRKLLVAEALLNRPDLLILDNPYIGLDSESKQALDRALSALSAAGHSFLLLISDESEVPPATGHRLYAAGMRVSAAPIPGDGKADETVGKFGFSPSARGVSAGSPVVKLESCTVSYGSRKIIDGLDWEIKAGQRWCVSGRNGSGKSTLLSLVCADNPKSYSCNVSLFGNRRGTGESIWDIKRRIGYVSPEMQLYFRGAGTLRQIIANGLNDTVGLFVKPTEGQLELAGRWMRHFGLEPLAGRRFNTLSAGERQLALVARAMIKEPELLILDEPMHGLDPRAKKKVAATIAEFLEARPSAAFVMVSHNPADLPLSITNRLTLQRL